MEQILAATEGLRNIMITSPGFLDGKTTVAVGLAMYTAMAKPTRKVLLVDLNLRDSQVHRLLGEAPRNGVKEYLRNQASLEDIQCPMRLDNLVFLSGGSIGVDFPETLTNSRFAQLMQEAEAQFDYVFYDSPAILEYVDAKLMANKMDGVVFICRSGKTKPENLKSAVDLIKNSGGKPLGVVLNKFSDPIPAIIRSML